MDANEKLWIMGVITFVSIIAVIGSYLNLSGEMENTYEVKIDEEIKIQDCRIIVREVNNNTIVIGVKQCE